ncbi:hypothetical protein BZARG_1656 [Bizionia argentinensis JUB59]|uniref:Uncharacterized protein n=1 Tax=Bizionia argentinensis JUB59 TaxID=1046627 RepID=G2EEU2_9FLAO|nr:hypothetical protein [Bizionia argentinensis]EGV43057.1 hypothetical protein BZARG_1656 [Bizionia argentinensis JUB59]
MALTKEHIDNLYAFTKKHFVEYYDLQTELVDHLANDIEVIMAENSKITFEEARDTSFKKFGVFGFMDVVEQRQKAMSKTYMKLLWNYAKDWFRLPQIIGTLAIFFLLYAIFSLQIGGYMFVGCYFVVCILLLVRTISLRKEIKSKLKKSEKLWFLEDIIFKNAMFIIVLMGPQAGQFINLVDKFDGYIPLISAFIFTLLIIYTYITAIILPKNATFHLQEIYPEYNM